MSEVPPPDPLGRLADKIDRARSGHASERKAGGGPGVQQGVALGFRIGIELVGAVIVAAGLGWAIDRWLGTRPWAMIVMFFLGVAAGMVNVYRAVAGMGMAVGYRRHNENGPAPRQTGDRCEDEEC